MELFLKIVYQILSPIQAAQFIVESFPYHCDVLALANVLSTVFGRDLGASSSQQQQLNLGMPSFAAGGAGRARPTSSRPNSGGISSSVLNLEAANANAEMKSLGGGLGGDFGGGQGAGLGGGGMGSGLGSGLGGGLGGGNQSGGSGPSFGQQQQQQFAGNTRQASRPSFAEGGLSGLYPEARMPADTDMMSSWLQMQGGGMEPDGSTPPRIPSVGDFGGLLGSTGGNANNGSGAMAGALSSDGLNHLKKFVDRTGSGGGSGGFPGLGMMGTLDGSNPREASGLGGGSGGMYGDLVMGMGMGMGGPAGINQSWGDAIALPPAGLKNMGSSRGLDSSGIFGQQQQQQQQQQQGMGNLGQTQLMQQMQNSGPKSSGFSLGGTRGGATMPGGNVSFQSLMSQSMASAGSGGGGLMHGNLSGGVMGTFPGRQQGFGLQGGIQSMVPMDNGGNNITGMLNGMGGNMGLPLQGGGLGDHGGGLTGGRNGLQQQRNGLDFSLSGGQR